MTVLNRREQFWIIVGLVFGAAWLVGSEIACRVLNPTLLPTFKTTLGSASGAARIEADVVLDRRGVTLYLYTEPLDTGVTIPVTWALTSKERNGVALDERSVAATVTNFQGDRKVGRVLADLSVPPGKYHFTADVGGSIPKVAGIPAEVRFFSKHQTPADGVTYLIRFLNMLIVAPLILILALVWLLMWWGGRLSKDETRPT